MEGFRVHENAAPLKPAYLIQPDTWTSCFRVHENADPLKRVQLNRVAAVTHVSAFMRTRPH